MPPTDPTDTPFDPAIVDVAAAAPVATEGGARRVSVVSIALAVVALIAGSLLFVSGFSMGRQTAVEPGTPVGDDEAFRPFWDTYHTITDRYAGGDVDREVLVQGAIRGMIEALDDPYSSYLTSDEYRQSLQGISGQFEGIGAEIGAQGPDGAQDCGSLSEVCHLVIVAPMAGSPAEAAGLLAGDLILAIDGTPLIGLSVDEARDRIRGPRDTVVILTVQRDAAEPFPLEITRDLIQQQEVESETLAGGAVGYVRLNGFSDGASIQLEDALRTHVDAERKKLILDLRGNPGGYVTAARDVASEFIGSGTLFWEEEADGRMTPTDASLGGVATDPSIQVVTLVDGGTASASEIVAGALQDSGRATLVGQTTFGKGTIQQWQELTGEGGAFRLTIARWLTPAKHWIHDVGIAPDVVVELPATIQGDVDPVLDRALEVLTGGGAVRTVGPVAA
jgi:carboxyl-terminal processing protease